MTQLTAGNLIPTITLDLPDTFILLAQNRMGLKRFFQSIVKLSQPGWPIRANWPVARFAPAGTVEISSRSTPTKNDRPEVTRSFVASFAG
jgi:hypothetical protein